MGIPSGEGDQIAESDSHFARAEVLGFSRLHFALSNSRNASLLISSYGLDYLNLAFFAMQSMFHGSSLLSAICLGGCEKVYWRAGEKERLHVEVEVDARRESFSLKLPQ
jgi:hypothetical protein